jgi:hypothetical protein
MALLLARTRDQFGEVLDRFTLDDWRRASCLVEGLELTDFLPARNPFTGADIRIPRPGAGIWRFRDVSHTVRFECGTVTIDKGHLGMHEALTAAATHLAATLSDDDTPPFAADRLSLAQLLRRSLAPLPIIAETFAASAALAPGTPCLILETSAAIADPSALALSLGYPHALGPNEILEQVACGALLLSDPPSDEMLVNALVHYMNHDAFLEGEGRPTSR